MCPEKSTTDRHGPGESEVYLIFSAQGTIEPRRPFTIVLCSSRSTIICLIDQNDRCTYRG